MAAGPAELDDETIGTVLLGKHLVAPDAHIVMKRLSGGVSADVVLATVDSGARYVLKQPRAKFTTTDDWQVDTGRGAVETRMALFLHEHLGPGHVGTPKAYDAAHNVFVMEAAPDGYRPWKDELLAGEIDVGLATDAGALLGRIHALGDELPPAAMREDELFAAQRIEPYFQTVAARVPELRSSMDALANRVRTGRGLIHGDFSPKNLLTEGEHLLLVDHEVATRGDEAFDIGFFLSHLLLKSLHRPSEAPRYHAAARAALAAYRQVRPDVAAQEDDALLPYLGACMVARVHGKSPVDYLAPAAKELAVEIGSAILLEPITHVDRLVERMQELVLKNSPIS